MHAVQIALQRKLELVLRLVPLFNTTNLVSHGIRADRDKWSEPFLSELVLDARLSTLR